MSKLCLYHCPSWSLLFPRLHLFSNVDSQFRIKKKFNYDFYQLSTPIGMIFGNCLNIFFIKKKLEKRILIEIFGKLFLFRFYCFLFEKIFFKLYFSMNILIHIVILLKIS